MPCMFVTVMADSGLWSSYTGDIQRTVGRKQFPVTMQQKLDRTIAAEQDALNAPRTGRKPATRLPAAAAKYALKRAIQQFGTDNGTDRPAILTCYAVLSLAPTLLPVSASVTLVLP